MQDYAIGTTPSAYAYPFMIKHLLHTPLAHAPDQEIVYRGQHRQTYATLTERIARLANALSQLGTQQGSTVAVMDGDSHRYLECYFAVPMMGAVLQTIPFTTKYEVMLAVSTPSYEFPDFDENTRATTSYTTGTTGLPKGVYFSHRQLVLHTITVMAALSSPASGQRFHRGDVYIPLTPMFHVHASNGGRGHEH
ncbi:hypothetical protein AYM40_07240 [Paraburkholderia phytofirmans OLGA172]|uniref:AMP-dependent synthetase/ligase domain-containing protein n=1 Tax=Paraburkholderia phytofirmans OLGA172 TaxID=1417228 RepID=A0A160FIV0_9BURK|nr:hypothetical protein AYM40_07240 [Paraburkholderia phytofirmans OLGA172]